MQNSWEGSEPGPRWTRIWPTGFNLCVCVSVCLSLSPYSLPLFLLVSCIAISPHMCSNFCPDGCFYPKVYMHLDPATTINILSLCGQQQGRARMWDGSVFSKWGGVGRGEKYLKSLLSGHVFCSSPTCWPLHVWQPRFVARLEGPSPRRPHSPHHFLSALTILFQNARTTFLGQPAQEPSCLIYQFISFSICHTVSTQYISDEWK